MIRSFCWHNWPKWSAPQVGSEAYWVRDSKIERKVNYQDRTCKKCGLYQVREVRVQRNA